MAETFKNAYKDITNSAQTIYTCPGSTTAIVLTLRITNVDGTNDDTIIALDQVTDPQNVGAIIRTFNFFGGKNLIITKDHSSEINGSLAKSASGALEFIDIIKVTNLSMALKKLRKKGFIIIGLDEFSDVMLHNIENYKSEKKVLVMGSEGKGLRRLTKENCDFLVSIANNNDSDFNTLNVSVSSALALYEFMGRDIKK